MAEVLRGFLPNHQLADGFLGSQPANELLRVFHSKLQQSQFYPQLFGIERLVF
jgi:hypothetical protein